jgi:kynurenine formamidase
MGKRIIDLTLNMESMDSWVEFPRKLTYGGLELPTVIEPFISPPKHRPLIYKIETTSQSFTHVDAPKHFGDHTAASISEVPLDKLIGEAVVIDMSHKKPKELVTSKDLVDSGVEIKKGDIVIIRTGWTDKTWGTRKFWEQMIGLSHDAGDWLINKGIKALATDFRADIPPLNTCERCGGLIPVPNQDETRHKFIKYEIPMIENCTNLGAIKKERVYLICLPLRLKDADGSPARVIAIEDE